MTLTETLLWLFRSAGILAGSFTVVRACRRGLHKRYPALLTFLILCVWRTASLSAWEPTSLQYERVWMTTEPLFCLSYLLLFRELCGSVLEQYGGIRTLARWIARGALVLALGITSSAMSTGPNQLARESWLLHTFVTMEQALVLTIAVLLMLLIVFAWRYPLTLNLNLRVYGATYCYYLLAVVGRNSLLEHWGRIAVRPVHALETAVSAICLVVWLKAFLPDGEEWPEHAASPAVPPGDLMGRLDQFSDILLQVFRKPAPPGPPQSRSFSMTTFDIRRLAASIMRPSSVNAPRPPSAACS